MDFMDLDGQKKASRVISLIGKVSSGKELVANFLANEYSFLSYSLDDEVEVEIEALELDRKKDETYALRDYWTLQTNPSYWARRVLYGRLKKCLGYSDFVIRGYRNVEEVQASKDFCFERGLEHRVVRVIREIVDRKEANKDEKVPIKKLLNLVDETYNLYPFNGNFSDLKSGESTQEGVDFDIFLKNIDEVELDVHDMIGYFEDLRSSEENN